MNRSPGNKQSRALARRGRCGAAILELALTLGTLLILTFGAVEFGYFFFVKNAVQGAAREGARAAIPPAATSAEVTAAVNGSLSAAGLNTANFTTTVKVNNSVAAVNTAAPGQKIEVSVTATWSNVGLRPLGIIASGKTVLGAAAMRKEGT